MPGTRWSLAALAIPLVACLQIGTGAGNGGQGGDAGGRGGSGAADAGPMGTGCIEDPQAQVLLCAQIDTCPNVAVAPSVFPDCGFRMHDGTVLDLECLCDGVICPIGIASTCDDARRLLDAQSSLTVCQQRDEGRCVSIVTAGSDAGPSGGSPCSACAAQCGGTPSCFQACGC